VIRLAIARGNLEATTMRKRDRLIECEPISVTLGNKEAGTVRMFLKLFTEIIHVMFIRVRTEAIPPDHLCEGGFLDHRAAG
jgi:hypothetical protein